MDRLLQSLLGLLLVCYGAQADVNCQDKSSIEQAQRQCMGSLQYPQNIEDVARLVQYNPTLLCSQSDNYTVAIRCAVNVSKTCANQTGHNPGVYPSSKLDDMLYYICDHNTDLNISCLTSTQQAIRQCVQAKASSKSGLQPAEQNNPNSLVCAGYRWNAECEWTLLAQCQCPTDRMFVKISKDVSPHDCPDFDNEIPKIECNPQTHDFISGRPPAEGGSQSLHGHSIMSLMVMVIAVLGMIRY